MTSLAGAVMKFCSNFTTGTIFFKLLDRCVRIDDSSNVALSGGWTAIHFACHFFKGKNLKEIVALLISRGVDAKAKLINQEANALHILCKEYSGNNLNQVIELFINSGINPNDKTTDGYNALHLVCTYYTGASMKESVQFLISSGIDVKAKIRLKDTKIGEWNLLHIVCVCQNQNAHLKDVIELLLSHGVHPNGMDKRGFQVLHFLCGSINNREDLIEILKLLIAAGMDVNALV